MHYLKTIGNRYCAIALSRWERRIQCVLNSPPVGMSIRCILGQTVANEFSIEEAVVTGKGIQQNVIDRWGIQRSEGRAMPPQ